MIKYADYPFYQTEFAGELPETEFNKVVGPASLHVRRITFERADLHSNDEEVKLATCAVVDVLAEDRKQKKAAAGRLISSENNDGVSVSFVNELQAGETAEDLLNKKIYKAAELYLYGTGLLELGC